MLSLILATVLAPYTRAGVSDFRQLALMQAVDPNPKRVRLPPLYNSNTNRKSIEKGTRSSDNVHAGWGDTVSEARISSALIARALGITVFRRAHNTTLLSGNMFQPLIQNYSDISPPTPSQRYWHRVVFLVCPSPGFRVTLALSV